MRSRSSRRASGDGSGANGSTSSSRTRATSSAKNGFPPERSWIRSRSGARRAGRGGRATRGAACRRSGARLATGSPAPGRGRAPSSTGALVGEPPGEQHEDEPRSACGARTPGSRRRPIEPLDVVDRDDERPGPGEPLQDVAHRDGERTSSTGSVEHPQQRDLERRLLGTLRDGRTSSTTPSTRSPSPRARAPLRLGRSDARRGDLRAAPSTPPATASTSRSPPLPRGRTPSARRARRVRTRRRWRAPRPCRRPWRHRPCHDRDMSGLEPAARGMRRRSPPPPSSSALSGPRGRRHGAVVEVRDVVEPNVAYRALNFAALWKKQRTLPSFAYAGIPYHVLGWRDGALCVTIAWMRSASFPICRWHLRDLREQVALTVRLASTTCALDLLAHAPSSRARSLGANPSAVLLVFVCFFSVMHAG